MAFGGRRLQNKPLLMVAAGLAILGKRSRFAAACTSYLRSCRTQQHEVVQALTPHRA